MVSLDSQLLHVGWNCETVNLDHEHFARIKLNTNFNQQTGTAGVSKVEQIFVNKSWEKNTLKQNTYDVFFMAEHFEKLTKGFSSHWAIAMFLQPPQHQTSLVFNNNASMQFQALPKWNVRKPHRLRWVLGTKGVQHNVFCVYLVFRKISVYIFVNISSQVKGFFKMEQIVLLHLQLGGLETPQGHKGASHPGHNATPFGILQGLMRG